MEFRLGIEWCIAGVASGLGFVMSGNCYLRAGDGARYCAYGTRSSRYNMALRLDTVSYACILSISAIISNLAHIK